MDSAIGQAVQRSRQQLGLSTATLAEQAALPKSDIEDLEAGKGTLAASALMGVARAMGLPPTAFLTDENATVVRPPLDRARFFHADNAPVLAESDVASIMRETTRAQIFSGLVEARLRLEEHFQPSKPGGKPWRQGYDLAASLRTKLDLGSERILSAQRVIEDKLGILVTKHAFTDSRLRAAAVRADKGRLIVVSKRLSTPLLRVSLAHELCHHICDLHPNEALGELDEAKLEEFTGADTGEERRAKAFAVMFLAPAALLRELFEQPNHQFQTTDKAVGAAKSLAAHCGIGAVAALWHLFHLNYLTDEESEVQSWQRHLGAVTMPAEFEPSFGDQDGLLRAIDAALASDDIDEDHADRLRRL